MLLQRLATGATGVKQARYRRRPTRGSEELVRACAQRNHIKPLRCGHPSIKARGSFPNGGHYRGVPLYVGMLVLVLARVWILSFLPHAHLYTLMIKHFYQAKCAFCTAVLTLVFFTLPLFPLFEGINPRKA